MKNKGGAKESEKPSFKLYSTTCSKLPQNGNDERRLQECRLASGFFLVSHLNLFKQTCNSGNDTFSRDGMKNCQIKMQKN